MYFDTKRFRSALGAWRAGCMSLMRHGVFRGIVDDKRNPDIKWPSWPRTWLEWRPESLLESLGRWIVLPLMLIGIGIGVFFTAVKALILAAATVFAVCGIALHAMRHQSARPSAETG